MAEKKKKSTKKPTKSTKKTNKTASKTAKSTPKKQAKSTKATPKASNTKTKKQVKAKGKAEPKKEKKQKFPVFRFAFVEAIVILGIIALIALGFKVWQIYSLPDTNFSVLPEESTIYAYEWLSEVPLEQAEDLILHIPAKTLATLQTIENTFLDENYQKAFRKYPPKNKTLAKIIYQGQAANVFIATFSKENAEKFSLNFAPYSENLVQSLQANTLIVTENKEVLDYLLTKRRSLLDSKSYQDAIYNVPKHSFATAYLNPKLLQFQLPSDFKTLEIFGAVVATLSADENGVYLSTYANNSKLNETKFVAPQKKYQAKLIDYIPENPVVVYGGQDIQARLHGMLTNLGQNRAYLISLLKNFNLDEQTLKVIELILTDEIAVAVYENEEPLIVFNKPKNEQELLNEINKLNAYYNAIEQTYALPDGLPGRILAPNPDVTYTELEDNTYLFELNDIQKRIYYYSKGKTAYLTTSEGILELVKTAEDHFSKKDFEQLMPISDELFYVDPDYLEAEFQDILDLGQFPTVNAVSNYFDDGIQTVHLLTW